ncbi:hypothetical protein EOD39_6327 [Acipenser ruthenus]|uniref:Uncharacterized protein n=1 Tax=Acipenser ruthenus TaxID=7906 RepID=A0A444UAJ6_ACIRT|nr:hypothetical protein EOD39_6327 [Acipenser ruthenus]
MWKSDELDKQLQAVKKEPGEESELPPLEGWGPLAEQAEGSKPSDPGSTSKGGPSAVIPAPHCGRRSTVKTSWFNRKVNWDVFHAQSNLVARLERWTEEEKAFQLAGCLAEGHFGALSEALRCPKLDRAWMGPCRVLEPLGEVVSQVQILRGGRRVVLHRDRLAPYRGLASDVQGTVDAPAGQPCILPAGATPPADSPSPTATLQRAVAPRPQRARTRPRCFLD